MTIEVRPVESRRDLKRFIHLPSEIHKDHKNWIPPLYGDEWQFFDPKKNKHFDHCDTILLLAWRGPKVVGRIMGVIHHEYNTRHNENKARFNFLEVWDEPEVSKLLIDTVAVWARKKGKDRLVGPFAFSDKDPQGYLIEGFDQPMVIASHCNYEYLIRHLEDLGFEKEIDLVVYKLPIPDETPEMYVNIAERTKRNNPGIQLLEFTSRRQLKKYIRPIFTLINETFLEIYGFTPFTLEEMDDFANRYLLVMDPKFIKVVINEQNETIAFVIAMPDISEGIRKSRGYLFPIGFIPILTSGKKSPQLNLLLGAIRPDYQKKGLDTLMGSAIFDSARASKKTYLDSHLEMETNTRVRAEMEYMGGQVYKKYRVFGKAL